MNEQKNLSWFRVLVLGGTFFGLFFNAAFATGGLALSYYSKYGWSCILWPIFSYVLIFIMFRCVMNSTVNHGFFTGREWANWMYAPYQKVMGPAYDIITLLCYLLGLSSGLAGMATLWEGWFGLPYYVGVLVYAVIILVVALCGGKVVSNIGGICCLTIIICMAFIYPQVIAHFSGNLTHYIADRVTFTDASQMEALSSCLKYTSYQCFNIGPMIALYRSRVYATRKDATRISLVGSCLCGIFLILSCLVVLSTLPDCNTSIPILTAINMIDKPTLVTIYRIMLMIALISSNIPGLLAMGSRWALSMKKPVSFNHRFTIVAILLIVISLLLSALGLMTLINKGYSYMGVVGLFFYAIPILTAGIYKTRRDNKRLDAGETIERMHD